jgi:hypothetical protein
LNDLFEIDALLLVSDTKIQTNKTANYFYISNDDFKKIETPFVMIYNNDKKTAYDFSLTEIGLVLYANQILYNMAILASTEYDFKINDSHKNKLIIRDTLKLFSLYSDNVENNILGNSNKINLSDFETKPEYIYSNQFVDNNIENIPFVNNENKTEKNIISNTSKINSKLELNILLRNSKS